LKATIEDSASNKKADSRKRISAKIQDYCFTIKTICAILYYSNMKIKNIEVNENLSYQMAKERIQGFYQCYRGVDLFSLITNLGITKQDFVAMKKSKMLDFLPKEWKWGKREDIKRETTKYDR
jgi:hypothetical protein